MISLIYQFMERYYPMFSKSRRGFNMVTSKPAQRFSKSVNKIGNFSINAWKNKMVISPDNGPVPLSGHWLQ